MVKLQTRLASNEVKKILAKGRAWQGSLFQARYLRQFKPWPSIRLAIVISKKKLPRAVDRNRCRRRARAAFLAGDGQTNGYDLVVFPKPQTIDCDFEQIKNEAGKCLESLRSAR